MLTSMANSVMIAHPGASPLFYGGMVRKRTGQDTVMTSFAITCLISISMRCALLSLAFREGGDVLD